MSPKWRNYVALVCKTACLALFLSSMWRIFGAASPTVVIATLYLTGALAAVCLVPSMRKAIGDMKFLRAWGIMLGIVLVAQVIAGDPFTSLLTTIAIWVCAPLTLLVLALWSGSHKKQESGSN